MLITIIKIRYKNSPWYITTVNFKMEGNYITILGSFKLKIFFFFCTFFPSTSNSYKVHSIFLPLHNLCCTNINL